MRQGDARVSRRRDGRRKPRNDLEGDARGGEIFRLFRTACEEQRVPPFQSDDALSSPRELDELGRDPHLRRVVLSSPLTDVAKLDRRTTELEQRGVRERVVQNHVSRLEQLPSSDGDE